ncbi:MAG: nucleotide sugar dehydrogenase [bacterium]|nr:nucleotide sugar dehydrogenase [bacterium]
MSTGLDINRLMQDIEKRNFKIGIIGLGYVGLPLAIEFARSGFDVVGLDVFAKKVDAINACENYISDVSDEVLTELVKKGKLKATTDFSVLPTLDGISICVPTPLGKTGDPDMSYILQVLDQVKKYIRPGQIIVLESTTYPGTTEEVMLPELQAGGLVVGKDFFLAFSPERIDPGNEKYGAHNTPKVIGGVTANCTKVAAALYGQVIAKVIPVSSTRAAEMAKLLENTFRSINIGLVNELAIMCNLLKVDVWEVIDAAASKPFGFMPFYPGPGLGGHCIPIDPSYLSWKLRTLNYRTRFIDLAVDINRGMPGYVVQIVVDALNDVRKCLNDAKILVLGVSYKRNIDDIRESPALDIIRHLEEKGGKISYHDPYVPNFNWDGMVMESVPLTEETLAKQDVVLIVTDHSNIDYKWVVKHSSLVVDTRNTTKGIDPGTTKIAKL